MHRQSETRTGLHRTHSRTINARSTTLFERVFAVARGPPPGSSEPDFSQHAQKCPQLAAARSARHNILCGTWCQVMHSLGCPPHVSPTARELGDPTQSPRPATGQTSSVSSRTALCSHMFPCHTAVRIHTWRRLPPERDRKEGNQVCLARAWRLQPHPPRVLILWSPMLRHAYTPEPSGAPRR